MSFYDALLFSKGQRGERGYSAYEIAVQNGYVGTEEEWANSFLSPTGYYTKNQVDLMMESVETDGEQRIESLLIGSENLIVNSGLSQNSDGFSLPQGITRDTEVKTPNNNNSFKYEITGFTQDSWHSFDVQPKIKINPGDELIFSVNVYIPSDVENSVIIVEFQVFDSNSTRLPVYPRKEVNQTITDQWQTISLTYEMPSQAMYVLPRVTVRKNGKCWVGDMKLVKGNKMTLWSPSSLDSKIYANNIVSNAMEKVNKKPYFFNNVAEMKAYNLSVGDIAITKGYYEPNDGGGAEYFVTQNQDNSTYQENANGLYFTLIYNNKINVKQIGLKDDPDFDNTDLLDKIIGIQYDTLIFPKGQYKIMAFNFPGDITIEGNGSTLNCILNTARLVGIGSNSIINNLTINSLNEDKEWNRIDFTNKHNIKFNNCKFSGFRQTTLNPQSVGYNVWPIFLKDCSDIEFNNCLFDNNSFQDILIEYNVSNIIFNNVNSVDGRGVYVDIEPSRPNVSKNITFINTVFKMLHTYEYYNFLDTLLNCSFIDCTVNELTYHRWKFEFYKYPN